MRLVLCLFLTACGASGLPPGDTDMGVPDASGRTCSQLGTDVSAWIASHQSCSVDGDCVDAQTRCGLPSTCGTPLSVSGVPGLQTFLSAWDAQLCGATVRCAPCPEIARLVGCSGGRCTYKGAQTCQDIANAVQAYINDPAKKKCGRDADCVATATQCGLPGVCGVYINQSFASGLANLSAQWSVMGCANGQPCPGCAQPTEAACNGGECGPK
jgi:hypothetical protein